MDIICASEEKDMLNKSDQCIHCDSGQVVIVPPEKQK